MALEACRLELVACGFFQLARLEARSLFICDSVLLIIILAACSPELCRRDTHSSFVPMSHVHCNLYYSGLISAVIEPQT